MFKINNWIFILHNEILIYMTLMSFNFVDDLYPRINSENIYLNIKYLFYSSGSYSEFHLIEILVKYANLMND